MRCLKKTSFVSPSSHIWEFLCDLLYEVNNEPLIFHVVPKLSASSNVSRNISCHQQETKEVTI